MSANMFVSMILKHASVGGSNHKKEYQFVMNHMLLTIKKDKCTPISIFVVRKKWFSGTPSVTLVW